MNSKRGLSTIVATLIIILLVIVAFGIISVVIRQTVTTGSEKIELNSKCLEVEIRATKVVSLGNNLYEVTLSRSSSGDFPLDGVDLIFEDELGENSIKKERIKENVQPLDKFTEIVTVSELVPGSVSVVPFFLTKAGSVHYCESSFTFKEITIAPPAPPQGV